MSTLFEVLMLPNVKTVLNFIKIIIIVGLSMTTTLPNNEGILPQQTELVSVSVSDRLTSLLNHLQPPRNS